MTNTSAASRRPLDELAEAGLFVKSGFLSAAEAAAMRAEMAAAPPQQATVAGPGGIYKDTAVRRSRIVFVSEATTFDICRRLIAILPEVAAHYGETLAAGERPQFLIYRPGDYFLPHVDWSDDPDTPEWVHRRRVAMSIFLNDSADAVEAQRQPDGRPNVEPTYRGGVLRFHRTLHPGPQDESWDVSGETGLLVAFRSWMPHEITLLEQGERYAIVANLLGP